MSGVVYYAAMSLDGYIAEADDTIEWLTGFEAVPPADGVETVEGGYDEFYEGIGALVTGSVTYEWVLGHIQRGGSWPYAGKPCWVLSSRQLPQPDVATSPERARESLVTIQDTGREAIVELRRMLGLLRDPAAGAALAPQPGVGTLDALLEQVRAAGLPVELTVEGEPRRLAPGIDRSAYRIVQEGLTNTLKHAGPAHANVRLRYSDHMLELEVLDDGHGPAGATGGGFGLLGMRERAALYGGALDAGARADGGYALHARLPLERVAS